MTLKRKNILITGASSGIGKGMALEYAKQGCNLALCARRAPQLQELKEEISRINPNVTVFIRLLDVSMPAQVFEVFKAFQEDFQSINEPIDRIIVNAGIGKGAPIGKGYAAQNMQTAITNFCGALSQFEAALEIFRVQNHGHLVAISSMSAFRGYGRAMTVYAATKAALKSLAEGVRIDMMNKPIVVTSVFPGFIATEMTEQMGGKPPFMIDGEKGARLLVKVINKETRAVYVPYWPWFFIKLIMPFLPLSVLRKI